MAKRVVHLRTTAKVHRVKMVLKATCIRHYRKRCKDTVNAHTLGDDATIVEEFSDLLTWREYAMHGEAKHMSAMKVLPD